MLADFADDDAWQVDPLPEVRGEMHNPLIGSWLAGNPPLFDVTHDATARLYVTNSGVSPCSFEDDDPELAHLDRHVPVGYTNLYAYEKRAVIADKRLVRLWPRRFESRPSGADTWAVLLPHKSIAVSHRQVAGPLGDALAAAVHRSSSLQVPAVVGRLLWSTGWH